MVREAAHKIKGVKINVLLRHAQKRRGYLLASAALFALAGIVFLKTSSAATYVVPLEAESGQLTGQQGAGQTANASNNASVKFGATGGGGGGGGALTHTWLSGMGGITGSWTPEAFASWRSNSPTTIIGTWSDQNKECSVTQCALDKPASYGLALDNAVGGIDRRAGETYAQMANGQLDDRFRQMLRVIDQKWGNIPVMYIRFAHEFNGSWYDWYNVGPSDAQDFVKAQQRFYQLVQEELVAKGRNAKVAYAPNSDSHNNVTVTETWPGDQYIDVVSVDIYDGNGLPYVTDDASWDQVSHLGTITEPVGAEMWRQFAQAHGKPVAFSEWGPDPNTNRDNPYYIKKMNDFFREHGGTGPGNVLYDVLFSDNNGYAYSFYPDGNVPNAINMYKSLKWGQ